MGRPAEAFAVAQILIDESLLGWKEFRDGDGPRTKAVQRHIVCAIGNGSTRWGATGDSITVAPPHR